MHHVIGCSAEISIISEFIHDIGDADNKDRLAKTQSREGRGTEEYCASGTAGQAKKATNLTSSVGQ
jgi:hypothetical protein